MADQAALGVLCGRHALRLSGTDVQRAFSRGGSLETSDRPKWFSSPIAWIGTHLLLGHLQDVCSHRLDIPGGRMVSQGGGLSRDQDWRRNGC